MPRLEKWYISQDKNSLYNPPELQRVYISGHVYDHPNKERFFAGKEVSVPVGKIYPDGSFDSCSGNHYTLGTVKHDYLKFLKDLEKRPDGDLKPIYDIAFANKD